MSTDPPSDLSVCSLQSKIQPFTRPWLGPLLLWPLLTSPAPSRPVTRTVVRCSGQGWRSPQVRLAFFSQTRRIYPATFRMTIGLPRPWPGDPRCCRPHPIPVRRIHNFVISFLQIPPRDGHPCLDGWFRSSQSMGDFHPLNASHTEHTKQECLLHVGQRRFS